MTEGHRLTEEDEANAVLITRAPALYLLLSAFVALIRKELEIKPDSLLVKTAAAILNEIQKGKVEYKVELVYKEDQPEEPEEEVPEPER